MMKEKRLDALSPASPLHHSEFLVRHSTFPSSLPWIQKTFVNSEGLAAQNAIVLLGRQRGMGNERAREMDGDWTGK